MKLHSVWAALCAEPGKSVQDLFELPSMACKQQLRQGATHLFGCHCLQAADRRYILLYTWMARHGAGAVNPKLIMSSAKRLRVT